MSTTQAAQNGSHNKKRHVLRHHKPITPRQAEYLPLPAHLAKLIIQSFLVPSLKNRSYASQRHLRPYRRSPLVLSTYDKTFVQEVRQVESRMPVPSMRYVSHQPRGRSEHRSCLIKDTPGLGLRGVEINRTVNSTETKAAVEEMAMRSTEARLWDKVQRARVGDKLGLVPGRELMLWAVISNLRRAKLRLQNRTFSFGQSLRAHSIRAHSFTPAPEYNGLPLLERRATIDLPSLDDHSETEAETRAPRKEWRVKKPAKAVLGNLSNVHTCQRGWQAQAHHEQSQGNRLVSGNRQLLPPVSNVRSSNPAPRKDLHVHAAFGQGRRTGGGFVTPSRPLKAVLSL
ncbi:hypothetical protein ACM66B_002828 [Microbotryomycetes sp. NB124-2]